MAKKTTTDTDADNRPRAWVEKWLNTPRPVPDRPAIRPYPDILVSFPKSEDMEYAEMVLSAKFYMDKVCQKPCLPDVTKAAKPESDEYGNARKLRSSYKD